MRRALLVLSALVLLLGAADAWLGAREARQRTERQRVGALFTREEASALRKLPALRIEAAGEAFAYGRVAGEWRCLSYHQAPADGRALQEFLDALLAAEGIVHTRDTAEAVSYGINAPETIRVSLQGPRALQDPGGDVQATLEIGRTLGEREGCFVRRKGTREVWAIAADLRAMLERRLAPALPPLLAPSVVPESFLAEGGATRIEVTRPGGSYALERRERALDPAAAQPGDLPWYWVLAQGEEEHELEAPVVEGYVGLLEHLPYVAVLEPTERAAETIALRLVERGGHELRLALGAPGAAGVALALEPGPTLYRVEARFLELVAPAPEALRRAYPEGDPWSAALGAKTH